MNNTMDVPAERKRAVAKFFDGESTFWRDMYTRADFASRTYRTRAAVALGWLRGVWQPGARLLELGSGAGAQASMAARDGWEVYGADLSFGMLREAAATAAGPSWIGADADAVPFGDETFDAVMMLGVIGYANDPLRTLAEVTRVLRQGGHLVIAWTGRPTLLESISRRASAVPDKLYLGLKHLVVGAPRATRVWPPSFFQAHGKFWNEQDFCRILGDLGYDVMQTRAIHFGRFRFMDRALWPPSVDEAVSIALEQISRLAPMHALRNGASTHVAVARRR